MRRLSSIVLIVALCIAGFAHAPASAHRRTAPSPTPTPEPTATPEPTPTPLSDEARLARLNERVAAIAAAAPGVLGVTIIDPHRETHVTVRGGRLFPLASVFKLAVAVAIYRLADQRKLDLDDRLTIERPDLRPWSSPIAAAHPHGNVSYTYWQLLRAMLAESDNTAADVLLRLAGGPAAVQGVMDRLGFRELVLRKNEYEMHEDARRRRTFARGGDNGGTPDAVAALLLAIETQRASLLDTTNEMLQNLAVTTTGAARIRAGLAPNLAFAHKTGTSDTIDGVTDATNDAGIVTLPDGRRIIVVAFLSESHADAAARDATLAAVGRAVSEAYWP